MQYAFEPSRPHAGDLASGCVIRSLPGFTAFPVRLGSELFLRAAALLEAQGRRPPYHVYDPTCGGGYLATVLGLLHPGLIGRLSLSDVSPEAVELARRNARLLSLEGLAERRDELARLAAETGRESHQAAAESAARLLERRRGEPVALDRIRLFVADVTVPGAVLAGLPADAPVDVVLADVPYGRAARWQSAEAEAEDLGEAPELRTLETLAQVGARAVALATRKGLKLSHPVFARRAKLSCGHRCLWVFERG